MINNSCKQTLPEAFELIMSTLLRKRELTWKKKMYSIFDVKFMRFVYCERTTRKDPFDVLRCPFLVDTKLPHLSLERERMAERKD